MPQSLAPPDGTRPDSNQPATAVIRKWLKARIAFYEQSEERQIGQVDHETEKLQAELWSAVLPESRAQPTIC